MSLAPIENETPVKTEEKPKVGLGSIFDYLKEKAQTVKDFASKDGAEQWQDIGNTVSSSIPDIDKAIVSGTSKLVGFKPTEESATIKNEPPVKTEIEANTNLNSEVNNNSKIVKPTINNVSKKDTVNSNLNNKPTVTPPSTPPKEGLGGIFGYLASKSGEGVDKGIFKNQKTLESQRKFEDNFKANEVKKLGKAGFNALTDFGNTLASQSGKASGQMVGNIFVPNTGVDWSSLPKNMQNREIIAANQAKVAQQAKERDINNAFKVADLKLKERGLDLEQERINNKDTIKPTDKAVSADAINSIRAMQSAIYKNRDYYGRGLWDSTLRVAKNTLGTKGAQLDADISQRFKPVALDLLKNFKGAISEGEREFLMNFVQGADTSPKALIDTLNDVARKIAIQSGNEFSDFDYGQAQDKSSEFKKVE